MINDNEKIMIILISVMIKMVIVIYNNNKNRSIMIVMKNRRMLKINKFVTHAFFYLMSSICSPMKGFFLTYQWQT